VSPSDSSYRARPSALRATGAFRRLTLFPASPSRPAAGAAVAAAFAPLGRGLVPLSPALGAAGVGRPPLLPGVPFLAAAAGGALLLSLWGSAVAGGAVTGPLLSPAPALPVLPSLPSVPVPLGADAVLSHFRPTRGDEPGWTLVEVDGKVLRAAPGAGAVATALAGAGLTLGEDDRVEMVPAAGGAAARAVVQRAVPFSLVDGGMPTSLRAAARTVGEALRASGVDVYEADVLQPPAETALVPGMRVTVARARPVAVVGQDVQVETRTRAVSVGGLLAEQGVTLGPLDRVEPGPEGAVPAYGTVRIVRVRDEEERVTSPLPYRLRQQAQPDLSPGARVRLQAGVEGAVEQTYRVRFEDGVEVGRELAGEARREPVDEVIGIGPAPVVVKAPAPAAGAAAAGAAGAPAAGGSAPAAPAPPAPPGGPDGARRSVTMVATAYDPGPASTGKSPGHPAYGITASGMRAGYGVVAVDPRVIPLGTRLYIPGYGNAVAGDTGGAIKGNRIDLGYATYGEAIRYGRQTVTVYVLE
jgi:uncharacterized protein YabE (DUF348 family)/3D (Asp-Asp-Asp) domain-containing protein